MRNFNKLYVKIVVALVAGLLLAGAITKITYACTPIDGAAECVSFAKAVMHPGDLINNKQDSLVHFSTAFVIASVMTFIFLSILSLAQKRKLGYG